MPIPGALELALSGLREPLGMEEIKKTTPMGWPDTQWRAWSGAEAVIMARGQEAGGARGNAAVRGLERWSADAAIFLSQN